MAFESNFTSVIKTVNDKLKAVDIQKMTAIQASTLLGLMRVRIHMDGIASDGTQIGYYTPAYMKTRKKAGRGSDEKVILSLTRSMENSEELYPLTNGTGIGFSTAENWQKAKWCEETYGKRIFAPTVEEEQTVVAIGQDYIRKHFK